MSIQKEQINDLAKRTTQVLSRPPRCCDPGGLVQSCFCRHRARANDPSVRGSRQHRRRHRGFGAADLYHLEAGTTLAGCRRAKWGASWQCRCSPRCRDLRRGVGFSERHRGRQRRATHKNRAHLAPGLRLPGRGQGQQHHAARDPTRATARTSSRNSGTIGSG